MSCTRIEMSNPLCLLIFVASFSAATADAQQQHGKETFTLVGKVSYRSGDAIAAAKVSVIGTNDNKPFLVECVANASGGYQAEVPIRFTGNLLAVASHKNVVLGFGVRDTSSSMTYENILSADDVVRMDIPVEPPKTLEMKVVDSTGASVAGLEVVIGGFASASGKLKFSSDQAAIDQKWTTNGQGVVNLKYPGSQGLTLLLKHAKFGIQRMWIRSSRVGESVIVKLLPVGVVEGQLTGSNGTPQAAIRNWKAQISTSAAKRDADPPPGPSQVIRPHGSVGRIATNNTGAFKVTVAEGNGYLLPTHSDAHHFLDEASWAAGSKIAIAANATTTLRLNLAAGVKVKGRFVSKEGRPIPGIELDHSVVTNADGRFERWMPVGQFQQLYVRRVPSGWVWPYDTQVHVPLVKDGEKQYKLGGEFAVPDIELQPAMSLTGVVVDTDGKPASYARVSARFIRTHEIHRYFTLREHSVGANEKGQFRFAHLPSEASVQVTAVGSVGGRAAASVEPVVAQLDQKRDMKLTLAHDSIVAMRGRVIDTEGRPVEGAEIKIRRERRGHERGGYGTRLVEWHDGDGPITTDKDGKFLSPGKAPWWDHYSAVVSVPGYLGTETKFQKPSKPGSTFDFGELEVTKARLVRGKVIDSTGRPLAGAKVWAHGVAGSRYATSHADGEGQFTLEGVHPEAIFVFAEHDTYQMSGAVLAPGDVDGAEVTLFGVDEIIPPEHQVKPRQHNDDRRHAALQKMFDPIAPANRNSNYFHGQVIEILSRVSREAALEEIARCNKAHVRAEGFARLGEFDDAVADAGAINDPSTRANSRLEIVSRMLLHRGAKVDNAVIETGKQLVADALLDAQTIRRPGDKLLIVVLAAKRLAELGDVQQAEALLRKELSQAQQLATTEYAGYQRVTFAQEFAKYDFDTAMTMLDEAEARRRARYLGEVAFRIALESPVNAERALKKIGDHNNIDSFAVRVAYRLAPTDLDKALAMLDLIGQSRMEIERARGWALIAHAIHKTQPERARELLDQAFNALPRQLGGGGSRVDNIVGASITFLRLAEEIAPDRLTQYYWKTINFHPGPDGGAWRPEDVEIEGASQKAQLALVLAQYDRHAEVAQRVLSPVYEYWEKVKGDSGFDRNEEVFIAMALADPDRAAGFAVKHYQGLDPQMRRRIPQVWEVVGNTLSQDRSAVGKMITSEIFHRWTMGAD